MESLTQSVDWDNVCNASAAQDTTVSPKDLLCDSSVPPSTAFTNLTTPSSALLDTPDTSYQTSPLFDDGFQLDPHNDWYSLFPTDSNESNVSTAPTTSTSPQGQVLVHPGGESRRLKRVRPSTPLTATSRHSSVAGVTKYENVLPPIVVDEGDTVALKRARNTAAARKSRDKKVKEKETADAHIRALERQVQHWKSLALALDPKAVGPEV